MPRVRIVKCVSFAYKVIFLSHANCYSLVWSGRRDVYVCFLSFCAQLAASSVFHLYIQFEFQQDESR